ncbi:MAG: hypothetical protein GXY55_14170 [Phycisphaerae bacterium]|nr:hypothetical protein [Phycisphaerae bacterium]
MTALRYLILLAVGMNGLSVSAGLPPAAVSDSDARAWIHHTTPLPKEIRITGQVEVPADQVAVRVSNDADPLIQQAAKELREALGGPESAGGADGFTITLQLGGSEAEKLKQCKNADQAYRIEPAANRTGLHCVAIGPRGLYYASKTLQQLVKARLRDGRAVMPVLRVTDWPDMADRGLWGGDHSLHLRWMSDRKMNYGEHISSCRIDKDKRCSVHLGDYKRRLIDEGPIYGIQPVPVILHLEQLKGSGMFEVYPDLQGKDATDGVICFSNPKIVDLLAEWLVLWGKEPAVAEVDIWMSENMYGKQGCQCERCTGQDLSVLEARAIAKAYAKARQQLPALGLRVLSSEATEQSNPQVLKELPPEVKFWYYHSLFTYNTSRTPMIGKFQPYLIDAIKGGRWVGVCPNLVAYVGMWQPMTSATFIHGRMNEFVGKGLSGLIGYAVPRLYCCWFNTEAAAEWTWNAQGRTTREFALSYAVRQGYPDPEKFADWSEIMGEVSWDVYGSSFPAGELRDQPGKLADLLRNGKLPELGYVLWDVYGIPFGDFKTEEQLNRRFDEAARGLQLAKELGLDEYLHESLVVQGYMNAIKALYELGRVVGADGVTDKAAATRWFQAYVDGLKQAREHLPAWEKTLPGKRSDENLVQRAVDLLGDMSAGMTALAGGLGIELK